MRVSVEWLKDYVEVTESPANLADRLTFSGIEVAGIESMGADLSGLVVAEVRAVAPHPNADRLVVCRVFDGTSERQVVCGAPNVRSGGRYPFAPPGAEGGDAHPSSGPGVSGAPVALKGRVLGVVSVKDIMAALGFARSAPPVALVAAALDGRLGLDGDVAALTVERVMTSPALTAEPAMAAFEAARLMSEAGVRRLPVLEAGRLSGVVTRTDLLRAFGNLL